MAWAWFLNDLFTTWEKLSVGFLILACFIFQRIRNMSNMILQVSHAIPPTGVGFRAVVVALAAEHDFWIKFYLPSPNKFSAMILSLGWLLLPGIQAVPSIEGGGGSQPGQRRRVGADGQGYGVFRVDTFSCVRHGDGEKGGSDDGRVLRAKGDGLVSCRG